MTAAGPGMHSRGFTLVEMIVVMVVAGIVAAIAAETVSRPILGFVDTTRRAALVDAGETASRRIIREARLALPNSVRLASGGAVVEMLRTRSGGRYRSEVDDVGAGDPLLFGQAVPDTAFDILGLFNSFGTICTGGSGNCGGASSTRTACMNTTAIDCLVIYNTGEPVNCMGPARTNAYCGDNVASLDTVSATSVTIINDATGLPLPSPNQRFHVVDTPVAYVCDLAAGTITRYAGYAIQANAPTVGTPPPVAGQVLTDRVTACLFQYDAGTLSRAALLTVRIELTDPEALNETVSLYQQAHVPNVP